MQKILACIDESTWSTSVEDAAIWAAKQLKSPLLFLHSIEKQVAIPDSRDFSGAIGLGSHSKLLTEIATLDQLRAKVALQLGKELLASAEQKAQESGCEHIETMQRHGEFVDTLLALENDARLVIIGHSGSSTGKKANVLGTHVENLLRRINTSVLITPHDFVTPSSFMLAYDGRATSERALQLILDSTLLQGLDCHLVAIKNKQDDLQEKLADAEQRLSSKGFSVTATFLEGDIFKQLLNYQQTHAIGMSVMGAFAGTRLRQFFVGSNTLKMLENSNLPVLVVK